MSGKTITVEVNGKKTVIPENSCLSDITTLLNIPDSNIVAELNGAIIKKNEFKNTPLTDGSKLELVRFVGGG